MKQYHLGLDVGGTNLVAGVVDENYRILTKCSCPAGAGRSIEEITGSMAQVSREAVCLAGLKMNQIAGWGIGMPSCVNQKTNLLVHANCFGWKNIPIYKYLEPLLPLPVKIENDANCAAYGEALAGAARGYNDLLMLTLGTGVGGGLIIDKKIYKGADGMGAELGHTKLVYNGKLCTCGQRGCLEAYCSATALIRHAKETTGKDMDAKMVFDGVKAGDKMCMELVEDYIAHLAAGISTFITIFRPEMIILGGGMANAGDALFVPLNEQLKDCTFGAAEIGIPTVIPATLGNNAGLIGAAYLFR